MALGDPTVFGYPDPSFRPTGQFYEPWVVDEYLTIPASKAVRGITMKGHPIYANFDHQNLKLVERVCKCVNLLAGIDLDNLTEVQKFALAVLKTGDLTGAKALLDFINDQP